MSNATTTSGCPAVAPMPTDPVPFFSSGNINFKAHDVGWLVSGVFSVIAMCASFWLINKHLKFFYSPSQQRHIVRILFMVPVYAVTSFLSYFYYNYSLYFTFVQDCYEAIVIASFFNLLVSYLSSPPPTFEQPIPQPYKTREERAAALQEVFRDLKLAHWMWPFGRVKWRPAHGGPGEGKAFLWLMRLGIGQYVVLVPLTTLIAVISEALGDYCERSYSPKYTHVWMSAIAGTSVTVAMYCVLQLYMPLTKELAPYKPVMKFLSVKSVVFLTFWQSSALSFLATVIKDHQYWSAHEIVIGLNGLLSCFEMMIFGFVHISAFSYLPYRALAEPVRTAPTATSATIPKSFAEWSTLEEEVKRREIEHARLAKMDIVDKEGKIMTKADGQPILQQTKRWPALWKCIALSDIAREIGQETSFVVKSVGGRKTKVDDTDRRVHLEGAFGRKRAEVGRSAKYDDEDAEDPSDDDNEAAMMVRPTARGEDGKAYPSIGRDGRLIDHTKPKGNRIAIDTPLPRSLAPPTCSDPFDRFPVLAYGEEQLLPSGEPLDAPYHDHSGAWWGSLRGRFWSPVAGYDPDSVPTPEFRQVERSTPVVVESMRTPPRPQLREPSPAAQPPPGEYPTAAIAGIPRLSDSRSLELPPPHLLTNNGPFPAPSTLNPGPSPPRPAAQWSRPLSLPLLSHQPNRSLSPFSESTFSPSGNRYSSVQPLHPPPPRAPDRFTSYTPPTRSRRSSAPREPRGMGEQNSRGLPPGAAPSAVGGSGSWTGRASPKTTGGTSFIFEEY